MTVLQIVLSITEATTVIAAAIIGAWGLNTWRREMIGRKKADLAEQTLAAFYEARDIFRAARFPGSFEHEGRLPTPLDGETETEARYRNAAYVPAERLLKENEFFARLEASKYRFMTLFGTKQAKSFDAVKEIRNRVLISSGMLIQTSNELDRRIELRANRQKWEQDIGRGVTDEDELAGKVEEAIAEIERTCRTCSTGK